MYYIVALCYLRRSLQMPESASDFEAVDKSINIKKPVRSAARGEIQRARSSAAKAALIAAARQSFAEAGYHATGINGLAAMASMTSGALYHHFSSKEELFEAVFMQVSEELFGAASRPAVSIEGQTWRQLIVTLETYLRLVSTCSETQQVLLTDGPSVLGWRRWRELQSEYVLQGIAQALSRLMAEGVISRSDSDALANILFASLNDAALTIAHAADREAVRDSVLKTLLTFVDGLRSDARAGERQLEFEA